MILGAYPSNSQICILLPRFVNTLSISFLTVKQKFFYAFCRYGTSIMINMVDLGVFWIYATHFELSAGLTGIGTAAGKVAIAISGFLFGYISDILPPTIRGGKRKIFLWIGAPVLAFSFIMLFTPHLFLSDKNLVFIWLLTWTIMFHTFYGFLLTPYQSWMPEITNDQERISVSAYQNTFNILATATGMGFVLFIAGYLEDNGGITGAGGTILMVAVIIIALLEIAAFLPTLFLIKEKIVEKISRNVIEEFKIVLGNLNYDKWMLAQGLISVALTIINSQVIKFVTEFLGLSGILNLLTFGVFLFGSTIGSFALWRKVASKRGKKIALSIGLVWLSITLPLTLVLGSSPLSFIDPLVQAIVFGMLVGSGLAAYYLFPYPIIADIADKDKRETGVSRAGIYTGFNSIPLNLFQAFGLILASYVTDSLYLLGPVAAVFLLLALPVLYITDLDPFFKKE